MIEVEIAAHQHSKHHEKMEALNSASARAVSGQAQLQFRARKLYNGTQKLPINAAHLQVDPDVDGFSAERAVSDAMALRYQHHNAAIHNHYCPTDDRDAASPVPTRWWLHPHRTPTDRDCAN